MFFILLTPVEASSLPTYNSIQWPTDIIQRKEKVLALVEEIGNQFHASKAEKNVSFKILQCENEEFDPEKQSNFITKEGKREPSFGLAQIHEPSHPDINQDDARDPVFSISYVVKNVVAGNKDMWTCGRHLSLR